MLISVKLTKNEWCVSYFRHINTRIAKSKLAFSLVRDTFSMLGNSKCAVLSVIYLIYAFQSLRLTEESKKYCNSASYLYQRIQSGLNISPTIWQSYINVILECPQSRKYCEAFMDDLLLYTTGKIFTKRS